MLKSYTGKHVQPTGILLLAAVALTCVLPLAAQAAGDLIEVYMFGENTPYIYVWNRSQVALTEFTFYIGDADYQFDDVSVLRKPTDGSVMVREPDPNKQGDKKDHDYITLELSGWDPGEYFLIQTDVDEDGANTAEDYTDIIFNGLAWVGVKVDSGKNYSVNLPSSKPAGSSFWFPVYYPRHTVTFKSMTEDEDVYVERARVAINGNMTYTNVGETFSVDLAEGTRIEVTAPTEVYRDIYGNYITENANEDPDIIQRDAEERFSAVGISVNNEAQTGDPTLYEFELEDDTTVVVKWRHDYALRIEQDFASTASIELDSQGNPWAGPLDSRAAGNPVPTAKKHWVKKGEILTAEVDGQVLDFTRPGLDVRYVPTGFKTFGPPNRDTSVEDDLIRFDGVDISTNASTVEEFPFQVGQQPAERQQVEQFTMYGPGLIEYKWQIEYGVRVNVDDVSRASLPKIYKLTATGIQPFANGEGTFWFGPGTGIKVASPAEGVGTENVSLKGWISGDGHYFTSSGEIDTQDGSMIDGGAGSAAADWDESFLDPTTGAEYRGLSIPSIQRASRVLWRYGPPALAVHATIGEYVFQGMDEENAYTAEPNYIQQVSVSGENSNVGDDEMAVWDPVAKRLYPVVPGIFRAAWRPDPNSSNTVDVLVTVDYPPQPHYTHIANTPPVALDSDPEDDLIYQEVKYTENEAVVDGSATFTASEPGKTVLTFKEIQRTGRGAPREFLRVRVVETKRWNDGLPETQEAIIGQKITDPALDLARFETGYVMFEGARYNPFVYDVTKLEAIGANDVYDTAALQSGTDDWEVTRPENLPGPVIPVNLHPGAAQTQRIVVVWYDDPTENDQILWPHAARVYKPRWPLTPDEGLGRIVIASQYGSESVDNNGEDQVVVGPVTNLIPDGTAVITNVIPAETTFNPSRVQQLALYNQPDPELTGYNPNEEHGLLADSLRYADVSPRPKAVYALRANDLNSYNAASLSEDAQSAASYSSHPFVLVQFFDTAVNEFRMRVFTVQKEDRGIQGYWFADPSMLVDTTPPTLLVQEPHVVMEAGEPVIPFYPLGVAIGAAPPAEIFGNNIKNQRTYWEDHRGSAWAVSGGDSAWFTHSVYYPLNPGFWWPDNRYTPAIKTIPQPDGTVVAEVDTDRAAFVPSVGDPVAFLPDNITASTSASGLDDHLPTLVLFKSDWPAVVPILKAGETLTFSGGEYRQDNATMVVVDDGELKTVQTPGLPGVLAFASAEVVYDDLNPTGDADTWDRSWTARIIHALDYRRVELLLGDFPEELQPASGRTRVSQGQYVFNELPASLQKRFRYDPINGKLVLFGIVNDKDITDSTLTASPPAVYVLEPNILTEDERDLLKDQDNDTGTAWDNAVEELYQLSINPKGVKEGGNVVEDEYLVGLDHEINAEDEDKPKPLRTYGPGLALVPNAEFLDPLGTIPDPSNPNGPGEPYPEYSWVTVVENNDPSLGGSPITPHVIKVDRRERYRGSIKTILSDNVFDENMVLRHTGDFGANADALVFEWWYRPDDGSLDVPPPNLIPAGQENPWMLFPDPTGNDGLGRYLIELKGNPNAPETLLADTWWFCRYRHTNDVVADTDWEVEQPATLEDEVNYTWAGAGNSDPFNDFDFDGVPDYRAQLAMGWIKRVLDAVNPYEARIRDFEEDNPSVESSMIAELGARFEGPVALNPDKDVIENVGLIELYETVLKRGRDLSIDLSRPVSTPAIANALQLASTRISDFYVLLGNEAYADALDPSIGFGSDSVEYGSLATSVHAFQNQMADLLDEELALLRGVDDYFARPVYNRLFWNFTKGEGEAAYAMNYDISDVNMDGFIDEADAMELYPQGHGDAWGHYLEAVRKQYELLNHPNFNWVSRSEYYNLMDIVIAVDFLDERKFASAAAARAKAGAEIVNMTYRSKYVEDPTAQWQGYTDSLEDRSWGVQGWARRAGQGAYFDWITANALLPSQHPNGDLEGIQKVDRAENSDITVISANLRSIQTTFDQANDGYNPLGLAGDVVPFDLNPAKFENIRLGRTHYEQIRDRAVDAMKNAVAVWDNANKVRNMIRKIANTEAAYRNAVYQEDLSYRNRLIQIFGRPYEGTMGPGKLYPSGYDGPDLSLFMYVDVREITHETVPGPATYFAEFDSSGNLDDGGIYDAFHTDGDGQRVTDLDDDWLDDFASTFASESNADSPERVTNGWFDVSYTDLTDPKVDLAGLEDLMPVTAAGYTFQAPEDWGNRLAAGELQQVINQMIRQEADIVRAIGAWDGLAGEIIREVKLIDARIKTGGDIALKNEIFSRLEKGIRNAIKGFIAIREVLGGTKDVLEDVTDGASESVPKNLPTGGLAVSPGDAAAPARGAIQLSKVIGKTALTTGEKALLISEIVADIALTAAENELDLWEAREQSKLAKKEWLKELEDLVGDEPVLRVEIFKQIEALRGLSEKYRALLDEGVRLIDERAAFNKRVAAQTQRNRYQDMTFRVARNHALQSYRAAYDLAARYTYMAAKAYDYDTNLDPSDPGSGQAYLADIVRSRSLGQLSGGAPVMGKGGLCDILARMDANYATLKTQFGINNPQGEYGKMSLRSELYRLLPTGMTQPTNGFPNPGGDADALWQTKLQGARVDDLWELPEYRYYCRPFADDSEGEQPGLVFKFGSEIIAGNNFFGRPLAGGDHFYDPSHYATKIVSVGVWFSDYESDDVVNDLPESPRVYLVPVGADVMSVPTSDDPSDVRYWNVIDQVIPVPFPSSTADLDNSSWIPLLDSLNGRLGDPRRFAMFRAYHNGSDAIDMDEMVTDSRLIGRSVWNTQWMLIIPGAILNADPDEGLDRFIDQVTDIKLVFQTYGYSGN